MCSLSLFPPPLAAGRLLIERNNELIAGDLDRQCDLPCPQFSRDMLKGPARAESKSAFLEQTHTLWRRSAGAWRDAGLLGLLDEITDSAEEVPRCVAVVSRCLLALMRWASSFHSSLFPHLTLSSDQMVAEFSQMMDWSESAVRSFSWHPHTEKFAVALMDDSIRIYRASSSTAPSLKHRCQRSVSALQWKPLCGSALAVACEKHLIVWSVDPCSLSSRPSSGCAQLLSLPGHSPITSLAWSPSGSLLVSASPVDTAMMLHDDDDDDDDDDVTKRNNGWLVRLQVWDVAAETCVPLRRVGGGGVTLLSWAPDGERLLAASPSALFRVWETRMWTCERWPCLKGSCQAACWSSDGSCLLFSIQGESLLYNLTFSDLTGGPKSASVVADLSETSFPGPEGDLTVGGEVFSLSWDPRGERLAVLLRGDPLSADHPSAIAVFKTRCSPVFELLPCAGQTEDSPMCRSSSAAPGLLTPRDPWV
ncbi:hypothetical protein DNTS_003343 [Danionella cerebrum]|uniref:Aladin seven-bladed propeller domain-containing protein n=1 Tax=Danionella cerebrum TaxID=2873325 RepID=A0A553QP03_9TELE|nr:hypothetical protein DNTS_003343 [Danionella translucida]